MQHMLLDDDLLNALRRTDRLRELFSELSANSQHKLVCRAGGGSRKRMSAAAIEAGLPSLLKALRSHRQAAEDLVALWLHEHSPDSANRLMLPEPAGWQDILSFRVEAIRAGLSLPELICSAANAVIRRDLQELSHEISDAARRWGAAALLLSAVERIDFILAEEAKEVERHLDTLRTARTEDSLDVSSWADVSQVASEISLRWGNDSNELRREVASICLAATVLGASVEFAPPEDAQDEWDVAPALATLPKGRRGELAARAREVFAEVSDVQAVPRTSALVELARRLPSSLPARDRATIAAEAEALSSYDEAVDIREQAPLLSSLARVLLEGDSPSEDELSWLETELTAKTLNLIQTGELELLEPDELLAKESDGEEPVRPKSTADEVSETEKPAPDAEPSARRAAAPATSATAPDSSKEAAEPTAPRKAIKNHSGEALAEESDSVSTEEQKPSNGEAVNEPAADRSEPATHPRPADDRPRAIVEGSGSDSEPASAQASPGLAATPAPPGDASALAAHLLDHRQARLEHASQLLARLIAGHRLDEAYWLASALAEESPLPPWLVEIAQLGLQLRPGFQESERRLSELIGEAPAKLDDLPPSGLLLFSASCLRPALVAPAHIYSVLVLHELAEKTPAIPGLEALLKGLAGFAEKGQALSPALLSGLNSTARLEEERSNLETETERWLREAQLRNVKFQAATAVWKHWTGEGGALRRLVVEARGGQLTGARAKTIAEEWTGLDGFTDRLDRTDKEISSRLKWKPIRYGAFDALRRLVGEAMDLVGRWGRFTEASSELRDGASSFEFGVLRNLKTPAAQLVEALSGEADTTDELALASRSALRDIANEVVSDFKNVSGADKNRDPMLERDRLLRLIPEIDPDEPSQLKDDEMEGLLRHLAGPFTVAEAARDHLERGRIDVAEELAEEAEIALSQKVGKAREWRRRAEMEIEHLAECVEHRQLQGVLTEQQKATLDSRVESFRRELEADPGRPDKVIDACADVARELDELARLKKGRLKARLESLERQAESRQVAIPEPVRNRVRELFAKEFLEVASEQMAEIQQGIDRGAVIPERLLDSPVETRYFETFFDALDDLHKIASDMGRVEASILAGESQAELPSLEPEQRAAAATALSAWRTLATRLAPGRDKEYHKPLEEVLRWLGFQLEEGAARPATPRDGRRTHFRVAASIEAPLPRFGTGAHRRHEVVLTWSSPEPASIAQWIASNQKISSDQPVTLLCLWPLDRAARRRWIHALRAEKLCVLLVDSCLMTWLCRHRAADRTRAVLAAGLPGGFDNPYMPEAAGGVAPEMFFGRDQHVDDLWRPEGPCIVFGGRQLGKSALLRQVVRRFHDPDDERFVVYEGLTYQPDIFEVLRELLVREGLLPKRGLQGTAKIKAAIGQSLTESPGRRILVLLDECDQFLDDDSKNGFRQVSELRNLMTETDRRFKVVFAGLHNVQRFQRIPNQPLAHFGKPLCVGPLEPPAGRDLVRVPFESLGYRFEPDTLASRVLAHTNSHPSLTQLFCHALMDELRNRPSQRREETPPFVIDEGLVASVYRNVSLGEKMRARFDWTLDLDLRYRALGYTFAYLEHEPGFDTAEGVPTYEVLDWARTTWPAGFETANQDELVGLLEEMKGLGILVGGPGRGYHLRSPNVLRLLGGGDEVQRELEGFAQRPYRPTCEPQVIRRIPREGNFPASPLSLDQEGRILSRERGLVLVLGSRALGVGDVWPALRELLDPGTNEEWTTAEVRAKGAADEVLKEVRRVYHETDVPGLLIHLVLGIGDGRADLATLTEIANWLDGLTHERRFVRVLATPSTVMAIRGRLSGKLNELEVHPAVTIHRLRRWKPEGLRQWFHDAEYAPDSSDTPEQWIAETGGWPALVTPALREVRRRKNAVRSIERTAVPPGELVDLAGLVSGSAPFRVFHLLADLGDDADVKEDLRELVQEDDLRKRLGSIIQSLLDFDLVIGSREKVRAEPVMAKAVMAVAGN